MSKLQQALLGSYQRYIAADFLSTEFFDRRHPLIVQCGGVSAYALKTKIADCFGDVEVTLIAGDTERQTRAVELGEEIENEGNLLIIDGCALTECKRFGFADFVQIMRRLRADDGCEWDRAQTHESIRINLIEEAYELVEAIDLANAEMMREECGDVLMQAVFHTLIAEKNGEFDSYDMLTELCRKLIDRHTHIFGANHANNPDEALAFWNEAKKKEKKYKSTADAMDRVPKNLPALLYAEKVQKLAKKSGFDWDSAAGAEDKLAEELKELRAADGDHTFEEAGDLLFAAVNVLRFYHVEPEMALREASAKFMRRFEGVERMVAKTGKPMTDFTLEQLDALWNKVKAAEKAND